MNKFDELLEDTDYTDDEWNIHEKVELHNHLNDFEYVLDEMLDDKKLTQEQYQSAKEKADIIVSKFEKWLDYEWRDTMIDAINYIIKGE